jgi:hypothetical protein
MFVVLPTLRAGSVVRLAEGSDSVLSKGCFAAVASFGRPKTASEEVFALLQLVRPRADGILPYRTEAPAY